MFPIFIPMRSSEPSRCPSCKEIESKKEVCKHCEYVYPEDENPIFFIIMGWFGIAGGIISMVFFTNDLFMGYKVGFFGYMLSGVIGALFGMVGFFVLLVMLYLILKTIVTIVGQK